MTVELVCDVCGDKCTEEEATTSSGLWWHTKDCRTKAPTVDEVCVIPAAGRGECWACPVTTCVLWQDPKGVLSAATRAVALKAASRLASRSKVIQPVTRYAQEDLPFAAASLMLDLAEPEVQYRLSVDMAAESILQDVHRADFVKRRNQYTDRWLKGLRGRLPTLNDDTELDKLMDQADADVAADHYSVKAEDVLARLRWFRDRRIVRRDV